MSKLYGIHQSVYEMPEVFEECREIELYFQIDTMEFLLYCNKLDLKTALEKEKLLAEKEKFEYALEFLMCQTNRFGVDIKPATVEEQHIDITKSYEAWSKAWSEYIYCDLCNDEVNNIKKAIFMGEDVSKYRPREILVKPNDNFVSQCGDVEIEFTV